MKPLRPFILAIGLLTYLPISQANECSGTTEELLHCHSAEVKAFLGAWVKAWGTGDVDTYLSLYTETRSPRDGLSRPQWESQRRARVSPDREIQIDLKLESMGLEDSGIFDVIFTQYYRATNFQDETRKRLFLVRERGSLKIWKEEEL